jgi:hypothetical protein
LLKRTLVRRGEDEFVPVQHGRSGFNNVVKRITKGALASRGLELVRKVPFDAEKHDMARKSHDDDWHEASR